jgi:hypothetical protein
MTSKQSDNGQMHRDLINWANIAGKKTQLSGLEEEGILEKKICFFRGDLLVKAF